LRNGRGMLTMDTDQEPAGNDWRDKQNKEERRCR
jgi:hypothetical protein